LRHGLRGESLPAAPTEDCIGSAAVEYIGKDCAISCGT